MPPKSKTTAGDHQDGSPPADLAARLEFLQLTEQDAQRLRALADDFEGYMDEFFDVFYAHLRSFQATQRFLQDEAQVELLKSKQKDHLVSMLEAQWDEVYAFRRRRVGETHAEVGIHPELLLGAYNQYVQLCFRSLAGKFPDAPQSLLEDILALLKVVFLDIGLELDAYFEQSTRQLRAALDMYWKANNDLRQFAQLTSHDLKTPLATVANLCDEAVDEFSQQMPQEARELIIAARERTFRMSATIDELLHETLRSQDADSQGRINIAEPLHQALERVRPLMDSKQIEFSEPAEYPVGWGNLVLLREVFYNVLSNACKYLDKPQGRVSVEVQTTEQECIVSISDNGPGVPASELDRIFAPFRRLRTASAQPGSGLGLYFSKSLVQRMGGRMWAESRKLGVCFHIALRLSAPPASFVEGARPEDSPESPFGP